jgi:hypothetical protein
VNKLVPMSIVGTAGVGLPISACATTFYVSASGSDAASGLSNAEAWRTIDKVNTEAASTLRWPSGVRESRLLI